MSELVIKSFADNISDLDDNLGIIKGYANVYNVEDSHKDISAPGSFVKTVSEGSQKPWRRIFKNHDKSILVGVPLELDAYDPYGLHLTAKMILDTDAGRDAYFETKFLFENGLKAGFSIGGWIEKRDDKDRRIVKEYKLAEISLLTIEPSNKESFVEVFKSLKEDTKSVQEFFTLVEKAYDEKGFSDPYKQSLENILKSLASNEPDPLEETTHKAQPAENDILFKYYSQFINK